MAKKKYIHVYTLISGQQIYLRFSTEDEYHTFCEAVFQNDYDLLGCEFYEGGEVMLRPASVDLFRRLKK